MRSFFLLLGLISLGAGCCRESSINTGTNGSPTSVSSAGASGSSTGGFSSAASTSSSGGSSGSSSGGSTTGTGGLFLGAIDAEATTVVSPASDAGTLTTAIAGTFLEAADWPACTSAPLTEIAAGCCFQPSGSVRSLNAGVVSVEVMTFDGGFATFAMPFQADGGFYGSDDMAYAAGATWSVVGGEADGTVLPLFRVADTSFFLGAAPVLSPPLAELTSLSTSQDWTVPLVPSEFEFLFVDRVIVEADGVGSVICQTYDEGALMPALVVPASMLARFEGHQGSVTVTRDDYPQWIDAGAVLLNLRVGLGARTEANEVSFGP